MSDFILDRYALPGLVTFAGLYQLGIIAAKVGNYRKKHKVYPPAIEGPPEFNRAFRAQQNILEFAVISFGSFWLAAIFFHPVPASLSFAGYIYFRRSYFKRYVASAEDRYQPFKASVSVLRVMSLMAFVGVGHRLVRYYFNYDILQLLGDRFSFLKSS